MLLRWVILLSLTAGLDGYSVGFPSLKARHPHLHGAVQLSCSSNPLPKSIFSWSKETLKSELCRIGLDQSAEVLFKRNVDGLKLLRLVERNDLVRLFEFNVDDALSIEAFAIRVQTHDELEAQRKRKEDDKKAEQERKQDEKRSGFDFSFRPIKNMHL